MSVTTDVENVEDRGHKKEVTVMVTSPKMTPQLTREWRAKARAFVAVGLANTVEDALKNLADGQFDRLADVVSHKKHKENDYTITWKIRVVVRNE